MARNPNQLTEQQIDVLTWISEGSPAKRIAGSYWTDRDSKGRLALNRCAKKYAEDFEEGVEIFSSKT